MWAFTRNRGFYPMEIWRQALSLRFSSRVRSRIGIMALSLSLVPENQALGWSLRSLIIDRIFFCNVSKRSVGVREIIHRIRVRSTPSSLWVGSCLNEGSLFDLCLVWFILRIGESYTKFRLITMLSWPNQLVFMGCHPSSFADHPFADHP